MATRITDEQKEQINELFYQIKVKSKVAKILGISASSVSKYIRPDYVPKAERMVSTFAGVPSSFNMENIDRNDSAAIVKFLTQLSSEEKEDLKELQKEIYI